MLHGLGGFANTRNYACMHLCNLQEVSLAHSFLLSWYNSLQMALTDVRLCLVTSDDMVMTGTL